MSMAGYSMGGLVARYAIGLLYKRGVFDRVRPINFSAFASPFLGVRAPVRNYGSNVWNALGGRTLSMSGRQLFLIDTFRDTGRPLLSVLSDKGSIFMQGLRQFKHHVLYANITNDRSAPWWTSGLSRSDPFEDMSAVKMNFVKGYDNVILDPDNPVYLKEQEEVPFATKLLQSATSTATNIPLYALMGVLIPIGTTAFLINSGIQSYRSNERVRLHNEGETSSSFLPYRIPVMMENAIEAMSASATEQKLDSDDSIETDSSAGEEAAEGGKKQLAKKRPVKALYRTRSRPEFPVLALSPEQFEMIENLNEVGFKKYPVWISKHRHTHAAIIVRIQKDSFKQGWSVVNHWLNEEFEA
jgi:hypothetical protein